MLAPSAPVLLGLISGEIWTPGLHLGSFSSAFREISYLKLLPQCGLLLGWEYLVLSHGIPLPHILGWLICRSETVVLLNQLNGPLLPLRTPNVSCGITNPEPADIPL